MKLNKDKLNLCLKKQGGQATVEYILIIAVIAIFLNLGLNQLREIFYGFEEEQGVLEIIFTDQIANITNTKW